jgi:chromosome segregation ATPase
VSTLTASELQALRQLKLLGDTDWGVLPLQLPAPAAAAKTSASHTPSTSTEVRRLQQERSYLLNRLQRMTRSLELRAEGIKQYFQDTIRREEIKRERAVTTAADLEQALKASRAKQAELEGLLAQSHDAYHTKVPALEAQVEVLQGELELRQSEALAKYRTLLSEESAKVATLENQLLQAKSASDKKDNRCRCLENDVRRLREAQDQAVKNAAELRDQLSRAAAEQAQASQELHRRIQDVQEGCEVDKRRLSEVIAEQQVVIADLRTRLAAAEGECVTVKSALEAAAVEQSALRKEVLVLQRIHEQYAARASEPRGGGLPGSAGLSQRSDAAEPMQVQSAVPVFAAEQHPPTGSSHLLQRLQGIVRKLDQPAH